MLHLLDFYFSFHGAWTVVVKPLSGREHARRLECPLAHMPLNSYHFAVILNFADKTTEDIFDGVDSKPVRRIPQSV